MSDKIQPLHRQRWAYVYLRQSSMGQVRNNQESTRRQYALRERAAQLGWPHQRIRVLDRDLGISGADTTNREDFKLLVTDVSMNKVGAVFALEASRLSRSCSDWHRLVELCSFTGTLLMDEDGCYDPADFNDRLLLGIKGTISHAELHFIRTRLQGGRLNKVRRGEYRQPLPVGYRYESGVGAVKDADGEVAGAIALLFSVFSQVGSAQGVVRHFSTQGLSFPKRRYTGVDAGKIVWGQLSENRVLEVLRNPCYAGAYAYGRKRYGKRMGPDGSVSHYVQRIEMPSWEVCIRDHHEGYIAWEEFLRNRRMLEDNRNVAANPSCRGAPRRGPALLQGLLLCGTCGHQMTLSYRGTGGIYPTYECSWKRRNGVAEARYCLSVRSYVIDEPVCECALKTVEPAQLQLAHKALEELRRRGDALDKQWRMKVERAQYQSQLAQRRYEEVDPSNRLVASTLEKRWEESLVELEQATKEYEEKRARQSLTATPEQCEKVLSLAQDLPRLWRAPSTSTEDRKRLLRLLVRDIVVEPLAPTRVVVAHVRWQSGACEDIRIQLPAPISERMRCSNTLVERIRQLAATNTDQRTAELLNEQGVSAVRAPRFTRACVLAIRRKYGISPAHGAPEEITTRQLADTLKIPAERVWDWIASGVVTARRVGKQYWLKINDDNLQQLRLLVEKSKHPQ
jgi:DNA invertase Pin-like site-specific DNA recombinase